MAPWHIQTEFLTYVLFICYHVTANTMAWSVVAAGIAYYRQGAAQHAG